MCRDRKCHKTSKSTIGIARVKQVLVLYLYEKPTENSKIEISKPVHQQEEYQWSPFVKLEKNLLKS